jgi:hypothetical protein
MMIITSMEDALKRKGEKVAKDKNVQDFLEEYYKSKGSDV